MFPQNELVFNAHLDIGHAYYNIFRYKDAISTYRFVIENAKKLNAFGFDLIFPSEMLEFITLEKMGSLEKFMHIDWNEIASGVLRVGGYKKKTGDISSQNVWITFVFKPIDEIAQSPSFSISNTFDDLNKSSIRNKSSISKEVLIKKKD